jgi:hypothetical protein
VKNEIPKSREEAFVCMFCGRAGYLDEFCFRHKRIKKRRFDYAINSYHDEFSMFSSRTLSLTLRLTHLLMLCLISLMDLTIAYMILVHEVTGLCLYASVMAHVLIMVIVFHIGLIFPWDS